MAWRVFIGEWDDEAGQPDDPDVAAPLEQFGSWAEAYGFLINRLKAVAEHDDCATCAVQARREADRLALADPGDEFACEIDGYEYVLMTSSRRATQELHDRAR